VSSKEGYAWAGQFLQSLGDVCHGDRDRDPPGGLYDLVVSLLTVCLSRLRLALRQAQSKVLGRGGWNADVFTDAYQVSPRGGGGGVLPPWPQSNTSGTK